jgi:hypothetical protein
MRILRSKSFLVSILALLTVSGLVAGGNVMLAQESAGTPEAATGASPVAAVVDVALPAHIHAGTCDDVGEVIFPLSDLRPIGTLGTPTADIGAMVAADATPAAVGAQAAIAEDVAVLDSSTQVLGSLDTILADSHVIVVHESAENIGTYVACGEIAVAPGEAATPVTAVEFGTPEAEAVDVSGLRQIQVQLRELNDSGFEGWAMLYENADDTTTVVVQLVRITEIVQATTGTPVASPEVSPVASPEA